jgi:nicotinamide mononucleotide transporter
MQLYYILAGVYGLMVWYRGAESKKGKEGKKEWKITRTPLAVWVAIVGMYAVLHSAIYLFLINFTDSTVPFWDSFTTALCIVAYWMLSRKYVEQWLVWLIVDVVTVGLYIYKDIPLTAGLYALYSAMAVAGYLRWRKMMKENIA